MSTSLRTMTMITQDMHWVVDVDEELLSHAHIQLHHGKKQVWNRGGLEPAGIGALTGLQER